MAFAADELATGLQARGGRRNRRFGGLGMTADFLAVKSVVLGSVAVARPYGIRIINIMEPSPMFPRLHR